jgi:exocyst complex component 1
MSQQTVQVDTKALQRLTQASLENDIAGLEEAATQLYKALQAGRDQGKFHPCSY